MSTHSLSPDSKLPPALRMLQTPRRHGRVAAPQEEDWLERLARWADLHPPRHHRLGSWTRLT